MARIRTIKPEFWRHEDLSALPEATHMLAAALLNYADDEGYFNANPALIRAECSPLREPSVSIQSSLELLVVIGYLQVGTAQDGKRYGRIVTFDDHQRVNRPTPSKIKALRIVWEDSPTTHPQLTESSPPERKGKEQGKEQGKEKSNKSPNGDLSASPAADAPTRAESIPYQAIVDAYNRALTGLPKVRELTAKRRTLIRSAWQASPLRRSPEFWAAYFDECQDDAFLSGKGPYSNGHENWRPSFDYLLRADVVTRTFERAIDRLERGNA